MDHLTSVKCEWGLSEPNGFERFERFECLPNFKLFISVLNRDLDWVPNNATLPDHQTRIKKQNQLI
jgi:hypothetical protein